MATQFASTKCLLVIYFILNLSS